MPKKGTLTKARIAIDAVIEQIGFPQKKSFETIEIMLEIIKSTLESGEDVLISGFGKFCMKAESRTTRPKSGHRRGYDIGTKKGRHIPVFGDTEGETEQKKGNGKKETRQEMKQFTIQIAGERIQISAKAELKGFAQPVESLPSRASGSNDKVVRLECWNYSISGANSEASKKFSYTQ